MTVDFRGVGVCVLVMAAVYVTAAVGPRRPDDKYNTGSDGDGDGKDMVRCGVAVAVLQELHTMTELLLSIKGKDKERVMPPPPPSIIQDCSTLREAGVKGSGVYRVFPFTFKVYCDMVTNGGGWTVIQRRVSQMVQEDFARDWSSYREGFGQLEGEMWLGLEAMHQLTHSGRYELRVEMVDYELGPKYAIYKVFQVGPQTDGYRLFVSNYSGNAGDALSLFHSGRRFSTNDRDQDLARNKSCAQDKEGGWWFHACYSAHPNGRFPTTLKRIAHGKEIRWWTSNEHVLVLTHFEMKIRRWSHKVETTVVRLDETTDQSPDDVEVSTLGNATVDKIDDYDILRQSQNDSDIFLDYPESEGHSNNFP